jgi:hypothetical protein
MKLADYGKYLFEDEAVRSVLSPLQERAKSDLRNYDISFLLFIEKWKEYAIDLLAMAKEAGFEDDYADPFNSTMRGIERILNGEKPIKSTDALGDYWLQYSFLANRFHREGKIDMIIPKHLKKQNNFYHLQTYYNHAISEWSKFKNHREIQVWWAYSQIERLAIVAYNLDKSKRIINGTSEGDEFYASDFRQILDGRKPLVADRKKFGRWIKMIHDYVIPRLENDYEGIAPNSGSFRLEYYPDDSRAGYKGQEYTFKGKSRALLNLLFINKNTPYDVERIKEKCNPNIDAYKFKADKDIRDTITYIRDCLKVKRGEYFPLAKRDGNFIWTEK